MSSRKVLLIGLSLATLPIIAQTDSLDSIPALDEVLVTGYRTISGERAAGSYDIVTSKEIDVDVFDSNKSFIKNITEL